MKIYVLILLAFFTTISCENKTQKSNNGIMKEDKSFATDKLFNSLTNYIESRIESDHNIDELRKQQLSKISEYIRSKKKENKKARLIFICTHNSRRSHLAHIWTSSLAAYFEYPFIECYSGGTEATAFNPHAVAALERAGFEIINPGGKNPEYLVSIGEKIEPMVCYSKVFDDAANPKKEFAAVMVCSDADENCPYIAGAEKRFSLPYEDPKIADGTEQESAKYDERCEQIAVEMLYMMKQI
jgi:arsenate reductase